MCDECNGFFGDSLEPYLARASFEGLKRFDYGIRSPAQFKRKGVGTYYDFIVPDGPLAGVVLDGTPVVEEGRQVWDYRIPPQILFRARGRRKSRAFRTRDVPTPGQLAQLGFPEEPKLDIAAVELDTTAANEVLEKQGYERRLSGQPGIQDLENGDVGITTRIDDVVVRALCKIAFNYFAYIYGASVALMPDFDQLRRYVLDGSPCTWRVLTADSVSILGNERGQQQVAVAHILTVEWKSETRGVLAQVSLGNLIRYQIWLSKGTLQLQPAQSFSGHIFNPAGRQISRLIPARRSWPDPKR